MLVKFVNDENVAILFDSIPRISVRYTLPSSTKDEIRAIMKYPFICKRTVKTIIIDKVEHKKYCFTTPKGYSYDGLSIPSIIWSLIGVEREDNRGLVAAFVHDRLCENHHFIHHNRKLSTEVLRALLIQGGIPKYKANLMAFFVDIHQTLWCNWRNNARI